MAVAAPLHLRHNFTTLTRRFNTITSPQHNHTLSSLDPPFGGSSRTFYSFFSSAVLLEKDTIFFLSFHLSFSTYIHTE